MLSSQQRDTSATCNLLCGLVNVFTAFVIGKALCKHSSAVIISTQLWEIFPHSCQIFLPNAEKAPRASLSCIYIEYNFDHSVKLICVHLRDVSTSKQCPTSYSTHVLVSYFLPKPLKLQTQLISKSSVT